MGTLPDTSAKSDFDPFHSDRPDVIQCMKRWAVAFFIFTPSEHGFNQLKKDEFSRRFRWEMSTSWGYNERHPELQSYTYVFVGPHNTWIMAHGQVHRIKYTASVLRNIFLSSFYAVFSCYSNIWMFHSFGIRWYFKLLLMPHLFLHCWAAHAAEDPSWLLEHVSFLVQKALPLG